MRKIVIFLTDKSVEFREGVSSLDYVGYGKVVRISIGNDVMIHFEDDNMVMFSKFPYIFSITKK